MKRFWFITALLISGCTGVPDGLTPVKDFDIDKYLGHWIEVARLDNNFERGLTDVSADYRKLPDGRIEVTNRGYDIKNGKWKESKGVARFQGKRNVGSLEVSFFWPFYGSYNILVLDPQYRYALVAGPNRDYLWILSRTQKMDSTTLALLVGRAREYGFDVDRLIFVGHERLPIMFD